MTVFQSSEQFYTCAESLFGRIQKENPDAAKSIMENKLLIRILCTDPDTEILINGRRNPATYTFGKNKIRPEIDIIMKTDTLHEILLGELSLPRALAIRRLKVRGPVWKVLTVAELFFQCQEYYPDILKEQGITS